MITPPKFPKTRAQGRTHNRRLGKVIHIDPTTGERKLVPRGRARADVVFRRLEQAVPRAELAHIMECCSDERAQRLFKMLVEPKYLKRTLPWMAMECGLAYHDVLVLIRNHHLGEGLVRMSAHAPQVMEDIAVDARSREVTCGNCKGNLEMINGELVASVQVTEVVEDEKTKRPKLLQKLDDEGRPMWERCLVCDGLGTLRKVGDAESRKIMFETLKLTGQRGPLIAQQFNSGGASSMEDAVGAAHAALDIPALPAPAPSPTKGGPDETPH
jgi:hypothetical protein